MKRTLLGTLAAAAAAAGLSASGFAINAAAQSDQQPTHAELVQRWAEAALDAQLKGMKTSLQLTADQEEDWGPFESAVRAAAKARVVALQKEQDSNLSPMDRNSAKAERHAQSEADIEKMVEAAKPLYASLDDTQKHKFIALGRMLVPERGQFAKEMRRFVEYARGSYALTAGGLTALESSLAVQRRHQARDGGVPVTSR
jgi:zinc resistance-associated protein